MGESDRCPQLDNLVLAGAIPAVSIEEWRSPDIRRGKLDNRNQ